MTTHDPTFCVLCLSGGHTVTVTPAPSVLPASPAPGSSGHPSCWLCGGMGGIAVHSLWSAKRGKPLWTAHQSTSTAHPVYPCPACRLAELENTLTWQTTCTGCARLLDSGYAETMRRERAEAAIERVSEIHTPVPCCNSRHDGGEGQHCGVCQYDDPNGNIWPCPTIAALAQPGDQPKGT